MTQYQATTIACIQMNSGSEMERNIEQADRLIRDAYQQGARFMSLPENAYFMRDLGVQSAMDYTMDTHPGLRHARGLAKELASWILIGSIFITVENRKRWANRSVVINPAGEVACYYDKIHLFSADFGDGESYRESDTFHPGAEAKMVSTPFGEMGLTICYDMRFARLFRDMAKIGATVFSAPAAFTKRTGIAHWHVLLRARAIENGAYVIAPGQCGLHPSGRETYGHSLIIDPWGEVLAEGHASEPCVITATIDPERVQHVRRQMPVLQHDRDYVITDYVI